MPKNKSIKIGQKHLIECNCILPQYKNRPNPIFHKFIVFSIIEDNQVEPKVVSCPHCGIMHKITEIGHSEITTKENLSSTKTIDDIKLSFTEQLTGLLEQHKCDLPTWEEAEFILDNQLWGNSIILSKENLEDNTTGKILIFKGPTLFKIETFTREDTIAT